MWIRALGVDRFLTSALGHGLDMALEIGASKIKHGRCNGREQLNVLHVMVGGRQSVLPKGRALHLSDLMAF